MNNHAHRSNNKNWTITIYNYTNLINHDKIFNFLIIFLFVIIRLRTEEAMRLLSNNAMKFAKITKRKCVKCLKLIILGIIINKII